MKVTESRNKREGLYIPHGRSALRLYLTIERDNRRLSPRIRRVRRTGGPR